MKVGIRALAVFIVLASALNGQFLYVANNRITFNDWGISAYRIDDGTGMLSQIGKFMQGEGPSSVIVDQSGKFLYASSSRGYLYGFKIDQLTGALNDMGVVAAPGESPYSLAVDRSNSFLFSTNILQNTVVVYRIDPLTGALSRLGAGGTEAQPKSVAVDPATRFVYTANLNGSSVSALHIDASTGALTPSGTFAMPSYPEAIAIEPTGRFAYVLTEGISGISGFDINPTTGVLSAHGSGLVSVAGGGPYGIAIHPSGRFAYVANAISNNISIFDIAPDGSLSAHASANPVPARKSPRSIAIDPNGRFGYVANVDSDNVSMYSIADDGGLQALQPVLMPAGAGPFSLTVARCLASPKISGLSVEPSVLWPPNQRMVSVAVNYAVSEGCGGPVCQLSVSSNQVSNTPDWNILGPHSVALRADREGSGGDRIYTIGVACTDVRGTVARSSINVVVPHDQGK